jgi:PII-like signaling protein
VSGVSQNIDRVHVVFDEPNLVANAGLVTVATLAVRLRIETLINRTVRLTGRVGGANPGSKILTLVMTLIAGGSHIDHADMLRAGATRKVLPFRVAAPSTLGTFLRSFTFGHVRQLDRVIALLLGRVWALGAGPGSGRLVIDIDSTITEVFGYQKQGAAYGYNAKKGYHPLVAARADTGEILHVRLRKGSSQKGHNRFIEELIARVRQAGAAGEILLRADAGFWSRPLIETLERLNVSYSITVGINPSIRAKVEEITDGAWVRITYPDGGHAEVASLAYQTGRGQHGLPPRMVRLIVRRTRLVGAQAALWPDWRYHVFVTNRPDPVTLVDQEHRHHAVIELAIRDLKEGAGLSHVPSGHFSANGAWLACAVIAHNLIRWTVLLGEPDHPGRLTVARTFRTQLVAVAGRIVNRAGRLTLRLPTHWPWAQRFGLILTRLRAIPQLV